MSRSRQAGGASRSRRRQQQRQHSAASATSSSSSSKSLTASSVVSSSRSSTIGGSTADVSARRFASPIVPPPHARCRRAQLISVDSRSSSVFSRSSVLCSKSRQGHLFHTNQFHDNSVVLVVCSGQCHYK